MSDNTVVIFITNMALMYNISTVMSDQNTILLFNNNSVILFDTRTEIMFDNNLMFVY